MNIVIRSNFCSEVKAQRRKLSTRKIAIGALSLSIAAAAGFWWVTYVELSALRGEHAAKMATDAKLDGELARAREKAAKREADAARRDVVLRYAASRTNLAPMLERLFAATPANVEISGLQIKAPNTDGVVVEVHGRSAGAQPRLECDKCRLLLANAVSEAGFNVTATFSKLEDAPGTIHFEECEYPAADFVIEMKLKPEAPNDGKT